jgi:protein-S-isoprenylcysteine O-methyltransferase Ste14
MSDIAKGWTFVTVQFLLFGLIFLTPTGTDWKTIPGIEVFALVGFGIALVALVQLGKSATASPVPKKIGDLVITGLYTRIRHPIYTMILLAFLLIAFTKQSFFAIFVWTLLSVVLYAKAIFEENMLRNKYPNYAEYEKGTGRFFPKIKQTK